jgi:hypothetical protein
MAAAVAGEAAVPGQSPVLDFQLMAKEQARCAETQALAVSSSLQLETFPVHGEQLLCDVSLDTARPVVPVSLRQSVFDSILGLSHPGI